MLASVIWSQLPIIASILNIMAEFSKCRLITESKLSDKILYCKISQFEILIPKILFFTRPGENG